MFSRFLLSRLRTPPLRKSLHTTVTSRAIPPVLYLMAKPLARVAAAVIGKTARGVWRRLPAGEKTLIKEAVLAHRKKLISSGFLLGGGILYAYESHLQQCPVTGRTRYGNKDCCQLEYIKPLQSRFVALYPDQMKKISRQEFEGLVDEYREDILPSNRPEYSRVSRVSNRILNGNKDLRQIYDKTWTVTVVDQPVQNAFVLPSGNIFIFQGMLDLCDNDDQLAIIIGHEMAHSILGHMAEKLTMASFVHAVMLVPMAVLWALMPNDGIALVSSWFIDKVTEVLIHLPFSRDMELEADEVGLLLAAKACFDVREAPALWKLLEMLEEDPLAKDKDFEFLATHPVHSTRYKRTPRFSLISKSFPAGTNNSLVNSPPPSA